MRGRKPAPPVRSNGEVIQECMGRRGHVILKISFSIENTPLAGKDLVLKLTDPGLVNNLVDEVTRTITKL